VDLVVVHLADETIKSRLVGLEVPEGRSVTTPFTSTEIGVIADALSEALCLVGLGEGSEPNALGRQIETVLDKFNPHE